MNTEDMLTLTCCQDHISSQKIYGLFGLKHHIVEMRGGVTGQQTTNIEDRATLTANGSWRLSFAIRPERCIVREAPL